MTTPSEKTPIKLGLMGAGLIGREHANLVRNRPDTELVAIADPSPEASAYATTIGVKWHADYREMLEDDTLDGVIIAVPNAMHVEAGMACIEKGLPMLMEKPVADTLAGAQALVSASAAKEVPILVGHHRRHSPDILEGRRAIQAGELGRIIAVNGLWWVKKPKSYFAADWRRQPGGGPLLINFIHDVDCLRFLCGEIDSVQAISSNNVRGFPVEDTAAVTIRFESGALGTFTLSDCITSPYTWDVCSGQALYFPHEAENCFFIGGDKASLALPQMHLWTYENGGDWRNRPIRQSLQPKPGSTYINQLTHFTSVIRREASPLVSAQDATMTLAATLAVEQAAVTGTTVRPRDLLQGETRALCQTA